MGYKYVPESWRKKFKVGQTVWFLDHINYKIIKGKFVGYDPYEREYNDTVRIESERYNSLKMNEEILESWTFSNKLLAHKCLKGYLKRGISQKKSGLSDLENKLKELK